MRRLRSASQRGETLVELLVAVTILGLTVVAVIGGLATSIMMSDGHRKRAMASAEVRKFAEAIQGSVLGSPTGYLECAGASHYDVYNPAGYLTEVTAVAYWNPVAPFTPTPLPTAGPSPAAATAGSFGPICNNGGVQRLSLRVTVNATNVAEQLVIYVRQPCRSGDPLCS